MTTIAFDGNTMCSDSRAIGNMLCQRDYKKIVTFRVRPRGEQADPKDNEVIMGLAGDPTLTPEAIEVIKKFIEEDHGVELKDANVSMGAGGLQAEGYTCSVIFYYRGDIFGACYTDGFWRVYPEGVPFAVGSGASFAVGAMLAGATAAEAVTIACKLDECSGLPVQSFNCYTSALDYPL